MDTYTACELAYKNGYNDGYNKALEEFVEKLKENSIATFSWSGVVLVEEIDNLAKEMRRK